jgi:hypothetical protein
MDLKRLAGKAKDLVEKRGGTEALKEDAAELKRIASGPGKATDKAKAAFEAVKDPGRGRADPPTEEAPAEPPARGGAGARRRNPGGGGGEGRRGGGSGN